MEGEYSEMCDVGKDYACICCSGAYESFDSIASVIEEKQKEREKRTRKITEKVKKIKATKGPALQEQIERRNRKEAQLETVLERTPQEKLMDAYFEKLEIEADEIEKKSCPIMIKSPCELLKSGSATCQCTECRGEHSDDDSVHSEDCLDLLPTTHV
jgi:hypothetical protein